MKNLIKFIGKSLLGGVFFCIGIILVYAATTISGLGQKTIESGDKIGTGWFNKVEESVVPQGAVMAFYGNNCPIGWVKADGSGDEIMTDGTAGTLDLRGEFIRGIDDGRGIDSGRVLGSYQNSNSSLDSIAYSRSNTAGKYNNSLYWGHINDNQIRVPLPLKNPTSTESGLVFNRDSNVISPRNIALLYCIKQ